MAYRPPDRDAELQQFRVDFHAHLARERWKLLISNLIIAGMTLTAALLYARAH